jgi:hypothetical protein
MNRLWLLSPLIPTLLASSVLAATATIAPLKDTTLYESLTGSLGNGKGDYLFSGTTNALEVRRGLISFDVAGAVPAGATIVGVELRLHVSKAQTSGTPISLHRVTADWGEGASNASGEEGGGGAAATGDATWIHRFSAATLWANAGGDFVGSASATRIVDAPVFDDNDFYTWGSTPQMVADVQGWLNNPNANFGWLLRGEESEGATAKRFDSRENPVAAHRPSLMLCYTTGASLASDFDCDGDVDGGDLLRWQQNQGTTSGATVLQGDANGDGAVNAADLSIWKGQFGSAEAVAGAVPEPTAAALAAAGLFVLGRWRSAKRVASNAAMA